MMQKFLSFQQHICNTSEDKNWLVQDNSHDLYHNPL